MKQLVRDNSSQPTHTEQNKQNKTLSDGSSGPCDSCKQVKVQSRPRDIRWFHQSSIVFVSSDLPLLRPLCQAVTFLNQSNKRYSRDMNEPLHDMNTPLFDMNTPLLDAITPLLHKTM